MDNLFGFIKERFSAMPQWVQVSTYMSFVVLFIYLLTAPRFLDMRLVSNDYGDEFPIGGAQIEVETAGRVLTLLTDTKGRFSVPISTNSPLSSYLFILTPDPASGKIKEVQVPVTNSYLSRSKIIYNKKNNSYKIVPNGMMKSTQSLVAALNLISPVYAEEGQPVNKDIETEILKALETITKISFNKIPRNVSLHDLALDNIDLSYINDRLNKKYNIDSLTLFLNSAITVEDLITIANNEYSKNNPLQAVKLTLKQAQLSAEKNLADIPEQVMKEYKRGKLLRKSKKSELAIQLLEKTVAQQPQFYFAWLNLALAYEDIGNKAKAEAAFLSAIELEKAQKINDATVYNAYGMYLFKLNRYKEAAQQFNREKQLKAIDTDL